VIWIQRLILLALCAVASPPAWGWTQTGMLGTVRYSVYAPEWTWQKQNVNLLFVFENRGPAPARVQARLEFPADNPSHFLVTEQPGQAIELRDEIPRALFLETPLGVGEEARRAFTNIYAKDGVPRQTYDFAVVLGTGVEEIRLPYALKTVRGAVVGRARSAIYIPVVVAGVWSILFVLILKRYAAPGAWRVSGRSIDVSDRSAEREGR